MKVVDIKFGLEYEIIGFGNLKPEEINSLNEIGLIKGELVTQNLKINCSKKICILTIDNSNFSIANKYVEEIELREI